MTIKKTYLGMMTACLVLSVGLACSKKENSEQSSNAPAETTPAPAAVATPIDPATAATVNGTVKFEGTAPKAAKIDMSQDPGCKGANEAENVVVTGGDLANVFVYVKEGLGSRTFDTPKDSVVLDQSGCKYHPHVIGVMTGQTVQIKNDDTNQTWQAATDANQTGGRGDGCQAGHLLPGRITFGACQDRY